MHLESYDCVLCQDHVEETVHHLFISCTCQKLLEFDFILTWMLKYLFQKPQRQSEVSLIQDFS